ncbi:MAG: M24 family metallopeptidase [Roseiflexaceae bacterium]|jgi:Xaa-Pro aminopeptidase|nr:Xaa-Pro peptidase family protein [Chloroflexaceae bacterium]
MSIYQEKADQASKLLHEFDLDCWLTFARETVVSPDPGIELAIGSNVTWPSAFIFAKNGQRIAIVGRYDVPSVDAYGVFPTVISYDAGISETLIAQLTALNPRTIGLNYSIDDKTSDGLTVGMYLMLQNILKGTPFADRLVSAGPLLSALRARKTAGEIARIKAAIDTTEEIVNMVTAQIQVGRSEKDIGDFIHGEFKRRGLPAAWAWDGCPIVNSGPDSAVGHGVPSADIHIAPGHIVHIDLGVQQDGYCSDIQRLWYVRRPGETTLPAEIQRAFDTVRQAIREGAKALRPGVKGHEVDQVARDVIVDAGYPEYMHAFGHGLGKACHDGGPLLGPRWERYGNTPDMIVEVGNIYTLELGVITSAGYVGLEEDVLVTENGVVFLSNEQTEMRMI